MIIKEIHIDGFGIFNGFSLTGLREGINIISGNNEAGKSTLLKFIRYTLFGYPRFREQRMQPLHGGNHGGRIKALVSSDKELIFERKGNDQITLHYDGQISQNESLWLQLLGNANKDIFDNVYAFSLDELTDMKSLSASGVEDKIFSIGMGLGNISVAEVESTIQNRMDSIYTPRGSKQQIPAILNGILDRKKQLIEIQNNLPAYLNLTSRIKKLGQEISDLENTLNESHSRKEQLDHYLKCYESFVSIIKIEETLKTLPELRDYPAEGLTRLTELESEEKSLRKKIQELQNGTEDTPGIEELQEEIDSISFNAKLLSCSDFIEYLRTNLELYKQTVREKTDQDGKIESIEQSVGQELHRINASWSEQNVEAFSEEISHRDRIRDFKAEFDRLKNSKTVLEADLKALLIRESPVNANNIMILLSIIFILGAAPLFYYLFYVPGVICLLTAILLFLSRKYIIRERPQVQIRQQLSDIDRELNEAESRFTEYLKINLKLEQALSTEAVMEILDTIKHLKKEIGERNELQRKREEQWFPFINKFEGVVKHIQDVSGIHATGNNIEVFIHQMIQMFDSVREQSRKKAALQNTLSGRQKELKRTEELMYDNEKEIKRLLKSIDAKDKDDFKKKFNENGLIKDLIEKRRNALMTIETISGLNRVGEVIDFLRMHKQQDISEELQKLEKDISEMRAILDDKIREMGEKKGEIKRIEGASALAQVMTELETERHKLNAAYRMWLTGKIALKLLSEVKETYEREKQPVVIKNSTTYFSKMTNGRYNRIKISLGEKDIAVFDVRETLKKIEQLSRGTREQLLISLRLGFIEEYESKSEPLPLIVDEVLVNFDPLRAKKAAGIFQEFGQGRQILVFTCRPLTLEYFNQEKINVLKLDHD